jgi:dihydrodipicolinate synthase/N-acetylneuraminate lyase
MNKPKRFVGVVIPAVTPVTADHRLDHRAVERLLANFRQYRAMPFILGTTGEAPSLSQPLKQEYIRLAGSLKEEGDVLYTGISSTCLDESVALGRYAFDCGADAVVATLPSYYPLSESDMEQYFEQLADAVAGPLIIYNIPATVHMSIPLGLIDRLSHHPNVVGVKDSERSDERLRQSLELWAHREDFSHFLGWAAKSAEGILSGSDGLIPSTGNLFPGLYTQLIKAALAISPEEALRLQNLSDKLGDLYQGGRTLGQSLWALKVLMQEAGLCDAYVLPPLQGQGSAEEIRLKKAWQETAGLDVITAAISHSL